MLKKIMKSFKTSIPLNRFLSNFRILLDKTYYLRKVKWRNFRNLEDQFTFYYENNTWGDNESVSGRGSTIEYTNTLRKSLRELFSSYNIKSIVDAPCGDFNWFRLIDLADISYHGCDIVPPLIENNCNLYSTNNIKFSVLNIIHDEIPKCDLLICRDVFFHFSNNDILLSIKNILRSDVKYILTTTFDSSIKNVDIETGDYRALNLQLEPFLFPQPILFIDDSNNGESLNRCLALWDRELLINYLSDMK